MAMTFVSPSMRASGQDLTVSISPLGLVELADEEFEVHGPRLNRYAQNWAFYLGHHWAYRREAGEPQITFNYVRALSDFITNFCFARSVFFKSPPDTEHIIPALLKRIWELDNDKQAVLWEMGQQGGVSGDIFVKVAYERSYIDTVGQYWPGRVRLLPLNAAFCFPEWHPHDRERLIRFKLKYRFWGTAPEGTRQVYTYTEIITEEVIEEYVNDEMVDQRPNPLGMIPIVHIPNVKISSSPWGLADIQDIIPLNREYNEKSLEVSDIINYHAAPVTIITGAKASNLERGPKKVWSIPPKDAKVYNLEGGTEAIGPAMEYLELLKRAMHEMTGVPESALGQMQPISNTSGVALHIQYQPMMQRYNMKRMTYGLGFEKINEIALRTLFLFEPKTTIYDPTTQGILQANQPVRVDPKDPLTYRTVIHWPPPLPVDALIKLNEEQMKMLLGIQSKRGALKELGEEFPDEKMQEIFEELVQDAKEQGALDMLKGQITAAIVAYTGMTPEGEPAEPAAPDTPGSSSTSSPPAGPGGAGQVPVMGTAQHDETSAMLNELVTQAYGTHRPGRRPPEND